MKDFRKGNDLMIKWAIVTKDGQPYLLPDKSYLRIEAHTSSRSVDSIEITGVSGNILTAMYYGKDQRYTGEYTLTLIENEGVKGMHTIDECKAFNLVPCGCMSSQENCDCTEEDDIEVSTVELESTLLIGIDNTEGGGSGGSGLDIDLITSGDFTTTTSDSSVYTSKAADERFLNKVTGGTVEKDVTFKKNVEIEQGGAIQSEGYDDNGTGFKLYKTTSGLGVLEVDKLQAKSAIFDEIVINQINFQRGTTVFSCAGCTIEGKVEVVKVGDKPAYKCYYDNKDEARTSGFEVGDLARCQRFNADYNVSTKYYWRKVLEVGDDYVVLSNAKGECHGDGTPEEHDDIVQFGNTKEINRQSAIVITPYYGTDIVNKNSGGGSVIVLSGLGAGENPFALTEKNYIGMGVKSENGSSKAYIYGYGDMYFGDRGDNPSQYIEYKGGKLNIKGNVTIGGKDGGEDRSLDQVIEEADDATEKAISAAAKAAEEAKKASETAAKAAEDAIKNAVADGSITASDKVVLTQESNYIDSQIVYIAGECARYGLIEYETGKGYVDVSTNGNYQKYTTAGSNYKTQLDELISEGGIVNSDKFNVLSNLQSTYYAYERTILGLISNAAKALADAAKTQANEALTAAERAEAATGGLNDDFVLSLIEKQSLRLQLRVITECECSKGLNLYWASAERAGNFSKVTKGSSRNGALQDAWVGWYASSNNHEEEEQRVGGNIVLRIRDVYNMPKSRKVILQFASDAEEYNDILYVGGLATDEEDTTIDLGDPYNTTVTDPWKQATTYGKAAGTIFTKEYEIPYGEFGDAEYADTYYIPILFKKDGTTSKYTDAGYYRFTDATSYFNGDDMQYFGYEGSFHLLYAQLKGLSLDSYADGLKTKLTNLIGLYQRLHVSQSTSTSFEEVINNSEFSPENVWGIKSKYDIRPALEKCFADYFDYVDICEEAIRRKDLSDVEYLKEVFPNNLDVDGASLAYLLGVKNTTDKIVAGLYGGASLELNKTGLYDNTATEHGTLMIFAGADGIENVSGAATRIYEDGTIYTNKLIAGGGEIGGFSIGTDFLTTISSNLESEVRSKMILNKKGIEFYRFPKGSTDNDKRLVIGTSIYSSSGYNELLSIENEESNHLTNYGIRVDVSGGKTNYAIYVSNGLFAGLRPNIRTLTNLDNNKTLTDVDCVVVCNGVTSLYLPSPPQIGQMCIIKKITSANVTIDGNGKSIFLEASANSITLSTYSALQLHYDGSRWIGGYLVKS